MIIFLAKARKLSILPTLLDIFDVQQHYVPILYLYKKFSLQYYLITLLPSVLG